MINLLSVKELPTSVNSFPFTVYTVSDEGNLSVSGFFLLYFCVHAFGVFSVSASPPSTYLYTKGFGNIRTNALMIKCVIGYNSI